MKKLNIEGFTVAKHLVICELSVFGIQDAKLKVDRTLQNHSYELKCYFLLTYSDSMEGNAHREHNI